MPKRTIGPLAMRYWGDPALRVACRPVALIDKPLRDLALDMIQTMYSANGVGLAAPQVGRDEMLCVIDVPPDAEDEDCLALNADIPMPLILFNPEILAAEGTQTGEEGCLSFPSIHAPVTRAKTVTFTYLDPNGQRHTHTAHGLLARAVQHELEHLRGHVFIDNIDTAPLAPKLDKLEAKTKRRLGLE